MQLRFVELPLLERPPMLDIQQRSKLPRLLDMDDAPSVARRRRYWRYVHRWRRRLCYLWRQDASGESDGVEIARGVDDLPAIALLLDYFRRSGYADLPSISEVHQRSSRPTPAAIATAFAATVTDLFVSAVLEPSTSASRTHRTLQAILYKHMVPNGLWRSRDIKKKAQF